MKIKEGSQKKYQKFRDNLPRHPKFIFLLFCLDKIGEIADKISELSEIQWGPEMHDLFAKLMFDPGAGKDIEEEDRVIYVLDSCLLLGFWHVDGLRVVNSYETFREIFHKNFSHAPKLPDAEQRTEEYLESNKKQTTAEHLLKTTEPCLGCPELS